LPELPKEGIVFFVGITLALTIAWFSLRKTQVQLSGFCLLLKKNPLSVNNRTN